MIYVYVYEYIPVCLSVCFKTLNNKRSRYNAF